MGLLDRILRRRRRHKRIDIALSVRIVGYDAEFVSQDLAQGGMRMNVGRSVSMGEITGGRREVELSIELSDGAPLRVTAEPIWTVRTDSGDLSTGWMFTDYQGDSLARLKALIDTHE